MVEMDILIDRDDCVEMNSVEQSHPRFETLAQPKLYDCDRRHQEVLNCYFEAWWTTMLSRWHEQYVFP